jgi:predicted nuclease of predicted toxin-antitoxin system
MKFLLDAQLPRRLAQALRAAGHDAIHTLDLPEGNRTIDGEINLIAEREGRVVVTKDADFVNSFYLSGRPQKLLLISTGNIANKTLEPLLLGNVQALEEALTGNDFIELSRTSITVHK